MAEQKATSTPPQVSWGPRWMRGFAAFACGFLIMDSGLQFLGVRIEWYEGLQGFGLAWLTAMTILPFVTGIVIGMIYGFGGKYLAHFPPVAVLAMAYYESVYHPLPEGVKLLPWPLWGFFVILMMEFCAFGGVIGELIIRRKMGWDSSIHLKADSDPLPEDDSDKA